MTEDQAVAETAKTIDGHRLAEFVYGTVTGMVALSGMSSGPDATWTGSIAIVIAGAVAIWLAHGYSIMLSKRVTAGHRLSGSEIASVFAGSWPIVIAGAILAVPFVLVGVGDSDTRVGDRRRWTGGRGALGAGRNPRWRPHQ